jgi:hypothetical protein
MAFATELLLLACRLRRVIEESSQEALIDTCNGVAADLRTLSNQVLPPSD